MTLLVVPQWFGSGSRDARRIAEGGRLLAERLDVPIGDIVTLPELRDGDDALVEGIRYFPAIREAAGLVRERLAKLDLAKNDDVPILVGGECGLEWGALAGRDLSRTAVLWLDAHPDFNTPTSSPSGTFHGMVLRRVVDDADGLLPARNVVPAGTRSIDDAERVALAEYGIVPIPVERIGTVVPELEGRNPTKVWIHVDVDVLDPREFAGVGFPEPGGLTVDQLIGTIEAVGSRWPLAGGAACCQPARMRCF